MGLLDAYSGSLETAATGPQRAPGPPDPPGVFHNFWSSAGNYYMRGMAEAGRAVSMAAGAVPAVADKLIGSDNTGEKFADRYFRWHDQTFGSAVDYWTPKPDEVGAAGQVVGSLAAGITQFLASPSLMVGTSQLSTAEDLVRKGVSPDAAMVAGDIAGLANVAGIALPIFGKTLAQRIATGAAGNLATNIPQAAVTQAIVKADGKPELAKDFDPWDVRARTVDVLLGAVFGAKAHVDARISDALLASNAARHIEEASLPVAGRTDAEVTKAVDSTRLAVEQMSRGEPVDVPTVSIDREANFRAWFGDSKVVDEQGRPLRVFHGTDQSFDEFRGNAYFTPVPDDASKYSLIATPGAAENSPNVVPAYISMRRPKEIATYATRSDIDDARLSGEYDGVIVRGVGGSKLDHYIAFRPEQIKSAIGNSGRFDPNSGSLTDPLDAYGAEMSRLIDEQAPIKGDAFKAPDMLAAAKPEPIEGRPKIDTPQFPDTVRLPTGDFDPATGMPKTAPASDVIAKAQADAADLKTRAADFMRVAATCLLGGV